MYKKSENQKEENIGGGNKNVFCFTVRQLYLLKSFQEMQSIFSVSLAFTLEDSFVKEISESTGIYVKNFYLTFIFASEKRNIS